MHLLFASAFRGKIADVFKSDRYKDFVALYSVDTSYTRYRYNTDKSFQIAYIKTIWDVYITNSLSQFNKFLGRYISWFLIFLHDSMGHSIKQIYNSCNKFFSGSGFVD